MKKIQYWCDPDDTALLTDLYHLTTAQSFLAEKMNDVAVFELYFRSLPDKRNYLVASGVHEALDYLETLRFTDKAVNYLASLAQFSPAFLDWLAKLRFTGDVYAVREGTIVFAQEPVIQIVAPLIEAQIIKSFLVNMVHYQTLVASKAARVVTAAGGRSVIDFGMRHTHGPAAAMLAAKAGYLSGLEATSNVLAGKEYGIPVAGTMAHSYVQSHDDEGQAFREFVRLYPRQDHGRGVQRPRGAARLGRSREPLGGGAADPRRGRARARADHRERQPRRVRHRADHGRGRAGRRVRRRDAPRREPGRAVPRLRVQARRVPRRGAPQVRRSRRGDRQVEGGIWARDVIARFDERLPGIPLLEQVMRAGKRLPGGELDLQKARARVREQLEALPHNLLGLAQADPPYEVVPSPLIASERDRLAGRFSWPPTL
jgi:nicotinate phosphoribosyltransferase